MRSSRGKAQSVPPTNAMSPWVRRDGGRHALEHAIREARRAVNAAEDAP